MMRRFVNLVSHKWCSRVDSTSSSGLYSLHRLDVAEHLFYPSTAAAADKAKAKAEAADNGGATATATSSWPPSIKRLRQLPAPAMTFQAANRDLQVDADVRLLALLSPGDSEGRILVSNKLGNSFLYDADANCVTAMPVVAAQLGGLPITVSLARPGGGAPEDLYAMHSAASTDWEGSCCFGVLRFGDRRPDDAAIDIRPKAWRWDPLPAPPLGRCNPICSHAVLDGGRTICVSARPVPAGYSGPGAGTDGTFCFDTVEREWRRAGGWTLPFVGGAEHVPGLGVDGDLWLGFAADDDGRSLCAASGLSAAVGKEMAPAPALQHVWRDACKVPGNWMPVNPRLIDLGGGRFCVARTCMAMPDDEYDEYAGPGTEVAVLSGVELLTAGDGSISVVEHKSLGYICLSGSIRWMV